MTLFTLWLMLFVELKKTGMTPGRFMPVAGGVASATIWRISPVDRVYRDVFCMTFFAI
jgi:hypothetical protein